MRRASPCPNCASGRLYACAKLVGGGPHGPDLLPGLGGFLSDARFQVVICADCGLTRFFADEDATAKLPKAKHWIKLAPAGG